MYVVYECVIARESERGFSVFHFNTPLYHPPANTELTVWLQQNFSGRLEVIPETANTEIGGIPAVKVNSPASPMAPAYEEVYFLKDENLYCIQMMAVDESINRQLYDQILSSFRFEE